MTIHFFWAENFPPLVQKGVNLSAEFFMRLDVDKGSDGRNIYRLTIKKNPDFIPGFWEKPNVEAVSAIIGKNGAGKSSVLRYILSNYPEGLAANMTRDLVAYSTDDAEERNFIAHPRHWNLVVEGEQNSFELLPYDEFGGAGNTFRFQGHLTQAEYIYYSFFMDYSPPLIEWSGLKNISTAGLMTVSRKQFLENELPSPGNEPSTAIFRGEVEEMARVDFQMGTELLVSEYQQLLPFPPPKWINVNIERNDRAFFSDPNNGSSDINDFIRELDKRNAGGSADQRPLNSILIALWINFFLMERKYSSSLQFSHSLEIHPPDSPFSFISRFFQNLANDLYTDGDKSYPIARNKELSQKVPVFIALLQEVLASGELTAPDTGEHLRFIINKESRGKFDQLILQYMQIRGITGFLSFLWPALSTGQQSFLALVSRFFHLKRHEIGNNTLKPELVILIDEGDAGFHPEWQRKFFRNTLNFLSSLFSEHRLQLIFTANAPFLTSDMPRFCVTFIERLPGDEWIIHDKENDREETFGSNIHTLLSDGFYLDGALMGDFAREKINGVIKRLNPKVQAVELDEQAKKDKKVIALIGEPVLRRKLELMWAEKYSLVEEEDMLKRRLQEIDEEKGKKARRKNKL